MKNEIVCIRRQGFSILHTEGADFAAKVTQLSGSGVEQEWLVPLYPPFGR